MNPEIRDAASTASRPRVADMLEECRRCAASGLPGRNDEFDAHGDKSDGDGESRVVTLLFISLNERSVVDCGTDVCTIAPPRVSRTRASYCRDEIVFPSNPILKRMVVRIFSWYINWNVTALRLLIAT